MPDLDQMKRDLDRMDRDLDILKNYIKTRIADNPKYTSFDPHGVLSFPPKNGLECVAKTDGLLTLFAKIAVQGTPIDEVLTWSHGRKRSRVDMLIKSILEHIAAIPDEQKFDRKRLARKMAYLISQYLACTDGKGN